MKKTISISFALFVVLCMTACTERDTAPGPENEKEEIVFVETGEKNE